MSLPPPFSPPPPPLWAPRLRAALDRLFRWLDARKARRVRASALMQADIEWRRQYEAWWFEHGWHQAAPTPDQAWANLQAQRRMKP